MIAVATLPTVPSTAAFCFLSSIRDKKHYPQNHVILKNHDDALLIGR
jgi:hypothetical protein